MGEFVRLEVADGVGTIRLDRPKMNAISIAVQEELRAAAAEATERDDVRAVVLYGGERVFAAGNDVKEMADMSYQDMVARSGPLQEAVTAVARIPKPVVAAVNGYALGGGCELALAADVRIAGERSVLGQPETLLGKRVIEMVDLDDVADGNFPIIFGDWSAYRIVDRLALSVLSDPYTQARKGVTRMHATRRVGGRVLQAARFRKLKMATS